MTQLEIVLNGIEEVRNSGIQCPLENVEPHRCFHFPEKLIDDIVSLLKEQEPRVLTLEEVLAWAETPAKKRDPVFFEQKEGKGPSGWICISLCPKDYYLCCLDGDARCWSARPTDEQQREAAWG